jgi:hypothetical protein
LKGGEGSGYDGQNDVVYDGENEQGGERRYETEDCI